jgi:hypothetical protein
MIIIIKLGPRLKGGPSLRYSAPGLIQIRPVWIGYLGTRPKKSKFGKLGLENRQVIDIAQKNFADKNKNIRPQPLTF